MTMSSQQNDGENIRANAEQLLQRVEKRELLLSLSPGSTHQLSTPQQQKLHKSIQHDNNARYKADQSLKHHGYVPKNQRRRVVVDGKVYVEEIEGESDGDDDCSFVSCLEAEDQISIANKLSLDDKNASKECKNEWVHLPNFNDQQSNVEDDCDWEPLVHHDADNSIQDIKLSSDSSNEVNNESNASDRESDLSSRNNCDDESNTAKDDTTNNQIIKHDESNSNEGDNPLLWIGGGLAFAGAVAGLAFANIKKKEHYENKARGSPR